MSTVNPLSADDIQWKPFAHERTVADRDLFLATLDGLTHDKLRHYCASQREDLEAVSTTLHETLAMLAASTAQNTRFIEQNRRVREEYERLYGVRWEAQLSFSQSGGPAQVVEPLPPGSAFVQDVARGGCASWSRSTQFELGEGCRP